ncbi:unnamed protein product [Polarella glacialis]|uniref:Threonine synthase n=1 Tax=Polarella glacialis TaxID=89957 RepID=A0A813GRG5_POLGL|nr:unnamed protein product [Polarella glacialis]
MKFCSTRGGAAGSTFEEAVSRGYAPDGGLYVPEQLPRLSLAELSLWQQLDFPSLQEEILKLFVGDELSAAELSEIVRGSYSCFSAPEIVPVVPLPGMTESTPGQDPPIFIAELFHGPTFCFKDLGLQPLVRLLARLAENRGSKRTFLVSTTGDTGPAAMRAVADAGSSRLRIVVFFPEGQISELQRRQMTTTMSAPDAKVQTARVASFEGGGDDMDLPLKRLGVDSDFAERHGLCGINSYNLGRPVCQMAHYFWSYFRAVDKLGAEMGTPIDIAVPSGALGNLAAGFMARQMGLPLRRLVAGVNSNDIAHRTIESGEFHRSEHMEKTLSDAINIQVPYNMERVFYYLTDEDPALVKSWMTEMDTSGKLTLAPEWIERLQAIFGSCRVDDDAMCSAMRRTLDEHGYLSDPHTAVGLAAAWAVYCSGKNAELSAPAAVVVLATASPCKFQASVTEAVGAARWAAYQAGPGFPQAARAAMAAQEQPLGRLIAQGSLQESHRAWETEVRLMLENAA